MDLNETNSTDNNDNIHQDKSKRTELIQQFPEILLI
jgi:hypothetical protein